MRVLISLGAVVAAVEAKDFVTKFEEFKAEYGRKYSDSVEELKGLQNFVHNVEMAAAQNAEGSTATFSHLSPLADMDFQDFDKRNSLEVTPAYLAAHELNAESVHVPSDAPTSFDWTGKGAVNPVKNQGQCGSCWAFGTVANIEGANFLKTGQLVSLSEQELVDCSSSDYGCNGGLPSLAYSDMIRNHMGLEGESDYAYTAKDGTCSLDKSKERVFVSDWKQISTNEDEIAAALVKYGPLAIGVNATPFQMYKNGILDPWWCPSTGINHAVTLVGYGEENGKKFWKIKNSWGTGWGEAGFIRVARGNWFPTCGLNKMVTTAFIADAPSSIFV